VANLTAAVKDNSFYTALRGEIEKSFPTTPINYSFAKSVGADNWIANALNFVPDGTTALDPLPNQASQVLAVISVTDGSISQLEFAQALRLSEMTSLTTGQSTYLNVLSNVPGGFNYSGRIATQLNSIFPATGAGTVQNQLALKATRPGSRAESLFGIGTVISVDDVAVARTLTGAGW
jgi:hypothetical protein